jgi:hypothetical protein
MSAELVKQQEGGNVALSATVPEEMAAAQEALIGWCRRKKSLMEAERDEAQASYEHALKHKWKASVLKRHADLFAKRALYYGKMLTALQAGYMIVPNMPLQLFAVRTGRKNPPRNWIYYRYESEVPDLPGQPMEDGNLAALAIGPWP